MTKANFSVTDKRSYQHTIKKKKLYLRVYSISMISAFSPVFSSIITNPARNVLMELALVICSKHAYVSRQPHRKPIC